MKRFLSFAIILLFTLVLPAQEFVNKDINKVDSKGRRQGYWKVYDVNGLLKFEGEFNDGIPMGTFKYYYPDGKIKAVSAMYEQGKRSRTKVFHNNGRMMAEGNYLDKKKDSTWLYYSDYDGVLLSREHYANGLLEGQVLNYYPKGNVAEEINYVSGIKQGEWKRYFTDGKLKLKAKYIDGKLQGLMYIYHQKGFPEVSGMYKDNYKDGMWMYYDEGGEIIKKERYIKGNLKETTLPDQE